MPSTGMPAPRSPGGAGGAPSAYTEAGPPDRMIAFGLRARISARGIVDGTICECTWHSRTRRAISCAYWAPKSTTRTVSDSMPASLVGRARFLICIDGRRQLAHPDPGDPPAVHLGNDQLAPGHLDGLAIAGH